jgi:hypothetical protein
MADNIFLLKGEGELVQMESSPYNSEALLQTLLAKFPDLLGGGQIDTASPRRWLLIKREMGIPAEEDGGERWSVDHLFLDQDAVPTLIEVKRSSDTRIRREVVGQMLDYAANAVVYWPVETIQAEFAKTCQLEDVDPGDRLAEFLGDEADPQEFWQRVKTSLQAGKIRMLFVADVIPPELRRIVEFLNEQMDPAEVLAVEIKQYVGHGMKTLVPRVIGQTAEAEKKHRRPSSWSGYWFVNVGDGEHRNWDDCMKYGFLSAGQGKIYGEAMKKLKVGDKVFGYMKGQGYVGLGSVTQEAVMAKDFEVHGKCLFDLPLAQPGIRKNADNPDLSEWVVGIEWSRAYPRNQARTFSGAFANPNIVCKLRDERTFDFLKREFGVEEG